METLVEERLNRDSTLSGARHFEIHNFSVGEYGIMQNVAVLERKALPFAPNAVLVGVFSVEQVRMIDYLAKLVRANIPIPWAPVREKLRAAGVDSSMRGPELRRRLQPVSDELIQWSYQRIVEICRQRGLPVVGLVLPEPVAKAGHDIDRAAALAAAAGLPLLDLRGVYGTEPPDSFRLPRNDPHWNVLGHKIVADRVYELLRTNDSRAFKLGFRK
jgi:hypothetical protein